MTYYLPLQMTAMLSTTEAPARAYPQSPTGVLSSSPFSPEFLVHASFIWGALVLIAIIVITYRRRAEAGKNDFTKTFRDDLKAMRESRRD